MEEGAFDWQNSLGEADRLLAHGNLNDAVERYRKISDFVGDQISAEQETGSEGLAALRWCAIRHDQLGLAYKVLGNEDEAQKRFEESGTLFAQVVQIEEGEIPGWGDAARKAFQEALDFRERGEHHAAHDQFRTAVLQPAPVAGGYCAHGYFTGNPPNHEDPRCYQ